MPPTAKMTAKPADLSGRGRKIMDSRRCSPNLGGSRWTAVDARPAVFKIVAGRR